MKKLLIIWFAILLSIVVYHDCHGQTLIKQGQQITSTDTVTVELQLRNTMFNPSQYITVQIDSANTGTVKFTVSRTGSILPIAPSSAFRPYKKGARIIFAIDNAKYNLFYKASASGQKFTVTE